MFDLIIDQLEGLKNPKGSSYDKLYSLLEVRLLVCEVTGTGIYIEKLVTYDF